MISTTLYTLLPILFITPSIFAAHSAPTAYQYIPGGSTAGLTPTVTTDAIAHTPTTLWYSLGNTDTDNNGGLHANTIYIPQTPCPTNYAWSEYGGYCIWTPCPSGYWYDRTSCEPAADVQLIVWFNGASSTNGTLQATSSMYANETGSTMVASTMMGSSSPMITTSIGPMTGMMATTTATSAVVVVGSSGALSSQVIGGVTARTTSSSSPASFASSGSQSGSAAAATYTGAAVKTEYTAGMFGLILPGLLGYLLSPLPFPFGEESQRISMYR